MKWSVKMWNGKWYDMRKILSASYGELQDIPHLRDLQYLALHIILLGLAT